jgi:putative membrane protein
MMGGGMMGGFGAGLGLLGMVFNLVILVGIVLLIVWAVQKANRSSRSGLADVFLPDSTAGRVSSAREILDTRYAQGELTGEEYQTILRDIS